MDIETLVDRSVAPSRFDTAKRGGWINIIVCDGCEQRSSGGCCYAEPCRSCGVVRSHLRTKVARWVWLPRPWWAFWSPRVGYWLLKGERVDG